MNIHPFTRRVLLSAVLALALTGCSGSDNERQGVERSLEVFARDLAATPIDAAALPTRIREYLSRNPGFFGSTVTLIDASQKASVSPYVYKAGGGYADRNLVEPGYDIDRQAWLAKARDSREPTWTDPYFDAGGGEIWMITRSVPLIKDGVVYAVVTTDLPSGDPAAR
jgi:sigma-B regulation protein RsbU (phosphoserine phosphatase)